MLAMLFGIAVAQPLFDVVSKSPQFLAVRDSPRTELVLFILLFIIAPAVLFALLLGLTRKISKSVAAILFFVLVIILSFFLFLPIFKALSLSDPLIIPLSIAPAILLAALILKIDQSRFLTVCFGIVVILVPAVFLSHGSILRIVRSDKMKIYPVRPSFTPPIVFIVFDELPLSSLLNEGGELDAEHYPNFAGLLEHFTWYRDATTVADQTTTAMPALLTGNYPKADRHPSATDYPENLFSLLAGSYEMRVAEPITKFYSQGNLFAEHPGIFRRLFLLATDTAAVYLQISLPQSYAQYFPSVNDTWGDFLNQWNEEKTIPRQDQLQLFMDGFLAADSPRFHFLHLMLPHRPWLFLPSGKRYNSPKKTDQIGKEDPWIKERRFHQHLLQLGYTDRVLGELLARLKKSQLYDRALIILTADHGITFLDTENDRIATAANFQDVASIPLFVKLPDQKEGKTDERSVESIDLVPTIADALGLKLPWKNDGVSLIRTDRLRTTRILLDRKTGQLVAIPTNLPRIPESVRRKFFLFGQERELYWLRNSPYGFMMGRSVKEFLIQESKRTVYQNDRTLYRDVKLKSGFLPAFISGSIPEPETNKNGWLAIAINGRICSITETVASSPTGKEFGAIVPESCFQEGENNVEFYEVKENQLLHFVTSARNL